MNRLKGKVAIVTGGAQGIGWADVKAFLNEGAKVIIGDLESPTATDELSSDLKENLQFVKLDVSKESDWENIFEKAKSTFGLPNILVNNAAVAINDTAENFETKTWQKLSSVDVGGTMLGIKYAIEAMKENGGSIINMSSVMGLVGFPTIYSYSAAKGAVRLLTKSAALYCAQQKYPIRINSVHPGIIATPMGGEVPGAKKVAAMHPMGRMGKPEEVANLIIYLASDESSFTTGGEFTVDGGYTAK